MNDNQNMTVLIADANRSNRLMLRRQLERKGYHCLTVELASLVQRAEDIESLVAYFGLRDKNIAALSFDPSGWTVLKNYQWPGNVKQLKRCLDKLVVLAADGAIVDAQSSQGSFKEVKLDAEQPAYVIYTSGSTGNPKGVIISMAAVTHCIYALRRVTDFDEHDSMLAVATTSFDISVLDLLLPLCFGAELIIADDPTIKDGRCTEGLALNKTNWANKIDKAPFYAYGVTCGITFTFGGLRVNQKFHLSFLQQQKVL